MSELTFDDILESALERAYDAGASHNNRILWEGLESLTSMTAARLRSLKVDTPSRIGTVRRFAAEERPLHVGVEWVRELAEEIDALTPPRPEPVAWAKVREMIRVEIVDTYTHAVGMTNSALRLIEADAGVVADNIVAELESTHPSAAAGGPTRTGAPWDDFVCTGCGNPQAKAVQFVADGRAACCPDCSTLSVQARNAIRALTPAPVVPVVTEAIAALAKLGLHELDQIMEPTLHPDLEDVVQSLGLATVDEHGEWTLTDKTEAGRAALTAELPEQPVPPVVSEAAASMLAERERQRSAEGWSEAHDDQHTAGVLGDAAACYAFAPDTRQRLNDAAVLQYIWPFGRQWWKPSPDDRRRELVKAGALILAEIERLDRTAALRPVEVERG